MNKFTIHWHTRNYGLWLIILINLVLMGSYLADKSNAKYIVLIFLLQSVLLGIENILKMLFCKTGEEITVNGELKKSDFLMNFGMAAFFTVHYGIFILVFGLMAVLNKNLPAMNTDKIAGILPLLALIATGMAIELPGKIAAVRKESPGLFKLMFVPYIRLLPLGLIILSDKIPPFLIFPLFLLLKTGVDIVYYFVVDKPGHRQII